MLLELEPELQKEYERFLQELDQPQYASYCVSSQDVLRAHFLIANKFYLEGEGLGGIGPKNIQLLQSAISRQHVSLGNVAKWNNHFDITATLFYGLIKNHPFHDANKRTAFLTALYQLHINGWCPSVDESAFEDLTIQVAESDLDRFSRFEKFVKDKNPDPEVAYISWFFRNNTRQIDKIKYNITYRELKKILNRYGFSLENAHNNYIDIVKIVTKREFFGFGREQTRFETLGQIGFPRWTAEVRADAVKTVREVTLLDYKHGNIDSGAFFKGLDPVQSLITSYHEPLMRLAYR